MAVETRVGPLRFDDVMEFTAWEPPQRMAIRHQGLVTGVGEFVLTDIGGGTTRFMWAEALTFPWYLGGLVTEFFAAPVMKAIWRRNLARLAQRFAGKA
jgi:carbon monoxide dehydrogenase subunit G